jgi:hypothetical protein
LPARRDKPLAQRVPPEGGAQSGGYVYPDYQFPTQTAPSGAAAQNGQAIHTYVTQSNHGTWLYQPNQNQGNGS